MNRSETNPADRGKWLARWVQCPDCYEPPFVVAYRCSLEIAAAVTVRKSFSRKSKKCYIIQC